MSNRERDYFIHYTKDAEKFFVKHEDVRKKYEDGIRNILKGESASKTDVKKIQGKTGCYYRMRIGDYRVIYAIINGNIVVVKTLLAGPRGDIYKKMNGKK